MKQLIIIAILLVFSSCKQESIQVQPQSIKSESIIQIDYTEILKESPSDKWKPMSMYPGISVRAVGKIDISKLPPDTEYKDLNRFISPPTGTVCTGNKRCEFVCGNTRYIITGIPNQCECHSYEGGLDIYCRGDCPSYELSCLR